MSKIKTILFLFVTLCFVTNLYAQTRSQSAKKKNDGFENVTKIYLAGKLNDTVYMSMVDSVASLALDKATYYSITEMTENLKQFEKVAWSKGTYWKYRNNYFIMLLNNAYLSNNWGASIFYAEKVSRQNKIDDAQTPRPFIELGVKMYIYGLTDQEDKQIETYERNQRLINDLLIKIKKDPQVYHWEGMDALRIMSPVINTYYHRKDTVKGDKAYKVAMSLIQSIQKDLTISINAKQVTDYYAIAFDYYRANGFDNKEFGLIALNKIESLLKRGDIIGDEYAYNLLGWKANLFLDMKQADSASFYIKKIEETADFAQNQKIELNRYKARLETLKGNPQKAYELLNKALEESFTMRAELAAEMDKLLYAYTEAEHHHLAFEKSEAEKKARNMWIITISLLLLAVIVISVILLRLKDRKLKKTVKYLDETANIQIALMEQFESEVRKEEQERLSQNLHDDLSGTLAAVKYNIDLQVLDTEENDKKEKLIQLSDMINSAFNKVRNKSHDLFEGAQLPNEEMFSRYIMHLAHIAFPENHYKLNLQIDNYALTDTSIEFRSELIRVIQEAFTNIIKHAKASQVDLWIYREIGKLCVVIKDNGKGIASGSKQNTMGIGSMQTRLKKFEADFVLNSHETGVEITISIPENTIKKSR